MNGCFWIGVVSKARDQTPFFPRIDQGVLQNVSAADGR